MRRAVGVRGESAALAQMAEAPVRVHCWGFEGMAHAQGLRARVRVRVACRRMRCFMAVSTAGSQA